MRGDYPVTDGVFAALRQSVVMHVGYVRRRAAHIFNNVVVIPVLEMTEQPVNARFCPKTDSFDDHSADHAKTLFASLRTCVAISFSAATSIGLAAKACSIRFVDQRSLAIASRRL